VKLGGEARRGDRRKGTCLVLALKSPSGIIFEAGLFDLYMKVSKFTPWKRQGLANPELTNSTCMNSEIP
jgi:hypothetical protein